VFLTGSFCSWSSGLEMTRQNGAFVLTLNVPENTTVEFKFIVCVYFAHHHVNAFVCVGGGNESRV
jgi:hypothetical protein